MIGLIILGSILLLLILFCLVRLSGEVEYGQAGLSIRFHFGGLSLQIFPFPKKKKKGKNRSKGKGKDSSKKKKESKDSKLGGSLSRLQHYLPLVGEAAGMLKQRIRIDQLCLDFTSAASDAASAAMAFGYSNMAIGILWPILIENFEVVDHRIRTAVDFDTDQPTVYLMASFSARIGQLISFCWNIAWKFLKLYRQEKQEKSKKEGIQHGEKRTSVK